MRLVEVDSMNGNATNSPRLLSYESMRKPVMNFSSHAILEMRDGWTERLEGTNLLFGIEF